MCLGISLFTCGIVYIFMLMYCISPQHNSECIHNRRYVLSLLSLLSSLLSPLSISLLAKLMIHKHSPTTDQFGNICIRNDGNDGVLGLFCAHCLG